MKILVTGRAIPQQPDRCTGQQLTAGFIQAGHECVFYGNFYGKPYSWLGAQEATTERFDLVVVTEMNDGFPGYDNLFSYLNLKDAPRLYWDFDVSYHPDVSYRRAKAIEYDGYLVGNRYYLGSDGFGRFGKPVLHLPYACSPQIHRRLPNINKNFLIGFIGSMTEERKRLVELCRTYAARRGDIFSGKGIFGDDLVAHTNSFDIMFHNNQDACRGLVPGRPWETTGCGTALLMDRPSYEDFVEFIPEDYREAILLYQNDTDICRALARQKSHRAALRLESGRLMEYVHRHHSYRNRAESIVQWAQGEGIL